MHARIAAQSSDIPTSVQTTNNKIHIAISSIILRSLQRTDIEYVEVHMMVAFFNGSAAVGFILCAMRLVMVLKLLHPWREICAGLLVHVGGVK